MKGLRFLPAQPGLSLASRPKSEFSAKLCVRARKNALRGGTLENANTNGG